MDFSFLAAAEKNTDIFFLFCSANISCKLKPNIFRYLNKRGKKGILALTENSSLGALATHQGRQLENKPFFAGFWDVYC